MLEVRGSRPGLLRTVGVQPFRLIGMTFVGLPVMMHSTCRAYCASAAFFSFAYFALVARDVVQAGLDDVEAVSRSSAPKL